MMYERYKEIRDRNGYKDADVVRGTGISHTVFSEWKSGKCNPGATKLQKIAEFFGVPIAYFLAETDEEEQHILELAVEMVHEKARKEKLDKLDMLLQNPNNAAVVEITLELNDESKKRLLAYAKFLQFEENKKEI